VKNTSGGENTCYICTEAESTDAVLAFEHDKGTQQNKEKYFSMFPS
jgi:hypothetical protein